VRGSLEFAFCVRGSLDFAYRVRSSLEIVYFLRRIPYDEEAWQEEQAKRWGLLDKLRGEGSPKATTPKTKLCPPYRFHESESWQHATAQQIGLEASLRPRGRPRIKAGK
jgi:hypothetical protein